MQHATIARDGNDAADSENKNKSKILTGTVWIYVLSACIFDCSWALVASVAGCFSYFYIQKLTLLTFFLLLPSRS